MDCYFFSNGKFRIEKSEGDDEFDEGENFCHQHCLKFGFELENEMQRHAYNFVKTKYTDSTCYMLDTKRYCRCPSLLVQLQ